jgi:hypothetical protein
VWKPYFASAHFAQIALVLKQISLYQQSNPASEVQIVSPFPMLFAELHHRGSHNERNFSPLARDVTEQRQIDVFVSHTELFEHRFK